MDYFNQESERLKFRKLSNKDKVAWLEFFEDNDRLHYLGIDITKGKVELAEEWIDMQLKRYREQGFGHLAVVLKASGTLIGMGGIIPRELDGRQEFEISYSLLPSYWGKGYGTEVAMQLKRFGFANLDTTRLISIIDIDNIDSIKVAKKNGMQVLFRTSFLGMTVDVYGIENKKELGTGQN